jgi:co-chaperonin GroES (HSP10)
MLEKSRYAAKGGWVVLKCVPKEKSHIILLDDKAGYEAYAEVESVGPGYYQAGKLIKPGVKVGELVVIKGGPRVLHPAPGDVTRVFVWHEDLVCTIDPSVPIPEQPKPAAVPSLVATH